MKLETIVKRLNYRDMLTQKGKLKSNYRDIAEALIAVPGKTRIFKLITWERSGGHCKLNDRMYVRMIELLDALQLHYGLFNDAPRGGQTGCCIEVAGREINKIIELKQIL